jgi:hypothetical protein
MDCASGAYWAIPVESGSFAVNKRQPTKVLRSQFRTGRRLRGVDAVTSSPAEDELSLNLCASVDQSSQQQNRLRSTSRFKLDFNERRAVGPRIFDPDDLVTRMMRGLLQPPLEPTSSKLWSAGRPQPPRQRRRFRAPERVGGVLPCISRAQTLHACTPGCNSLRRARRMSSRPSGRAMSMSS